VRHERPPCERVEELDSSNSTPEVSPTSTTILVSTSSAFHTRVSEYGRAWIQLVNKLGGTHHGYIMPSEGDSDEAFALFTFPSLAEYEVYRTA
jgi:hypothetical protein